MWKGYIWFLFVVISVAILGKSEVAYFHDIVVSKQDVARSEITMYYLYSKATRLQLTMYSRVSDGGTPAPPPFYIHTHAIFHPYVSADRDFLQVVKVIWQQAASPPHHMDDSVVFARLR